MKHPLRWLVTAGLTALFAVMLLAAPPKGQKPDDVAALRKEIEALKAAQAAMQRDLTAIKTLLQGRAQPQPQGPTGAEWIGASIPVAGVPARGLDTAKVTLVEVSDFQCPFCRRHVQQTLPQIEAEYVKTGKIRYMFADYPVAQLHPDAFKSHEAANCAGDQGKYWQMHAVLFAAPPARGAGQMAVLTGLAQNIGLDIAKFGACMSSGAHSASVRDSVKRMEQLGVPGTPIFFLGATPAAGQPMKIDAFVYGAKPYAEFKAAIDQLLKP